MGGSPVDKMAWNRLAFAMAVTKESPMEDCARAGDSVRCRWDRGRRMADICNQPRKDMQEGEVQVRVFSVGKDD